MDADDLFLTTDAVHVPLCREPEGRKLATAIYEALLHMESVNNNAHAILMSVGSTRPLLKEVKMPLSDLADASGLLNSWSAATVITSQPAMPRASPSLISPHLFLSMSFPSLDTQQALCYHLGWRQRR